MKTIWIVLRSSLYTRRPVMSVLDNLLNSKDYNIKIITVEKMRESHTNLQEFIFSKKYGRDPISKLLEYIAFRNFTNSILSKYLKSDDIVWLGSLDTINACIGLKIFNDIKYICHIHELYDTHPFRLKVAKSFIQKAYKVIVPELNRARILQVWLNLNERPVVYPNKPSDHPREKYITPTHETTKNVIKNYDSSKKIIIYQGHIEKGRSLEPIIEAIKEIDNIEFWLIGIDHGYAGELLIMSDKVKYWGYIPAPYHLEITSYADLGIMSYDLINLNHMYCAPNKVWEYLGFNLFFICNEVGSLDSFKLHGCCDLLDFKNKNDIKLSIVKNLQVKHNFSNYYDSVNLDEILKNILKAKSESLNESTKI